MNPMFIHSQSENQQRLIDALRRISDENDEVALKTSDPLPDHFPFFPEHHLLPNGLGSSFSHTGASDPMAFTLDFQDSSDSTLSYDPIDTDSDGQRLQVDRNGAKVGENASGSALVPATVLPDFSRSVSMSTCSSMQCSPRSPATATVFAAAVTAAMIIDPPAGLSKRPRSPSSDSVEENYMADDDTDGNNTHDADDSTDASSDILEESLEGPDSSPTRGSPRTVLPMYGRPVGASLSIPHRGSIDHGTSLSAIRGPQPSLQGTAAYSRAVVINRNERVAQTAELAQEKYISADMESSRNAALSRKRRAEAMERFRRKKAVRCYGRRVRYQIRKRIATTRPRVNGRFARRVDIEPNRSSNSTKDK